jgi:putative ABC transport system ATP-binding protein
MTLLEMNGVKRHYVMPSGTVKALDGIDIEIDEGERIILLGPSGSGKTTLLNCLSALDTPTEGTYFFDGKEVPKSLSTKPRWRPGFNWLRPIEAILFSPIEYFLYSRPIAKASENMTSFRRENIGYVFQFFNLLQDLTILENILLIQELSGGRDEERARNLLKLVGLVDETDRFPAEISGGQQQRVAIARSIAKSPRLLLGDELTGNLDSKTSAMVMEVLVKACESEGITCVFVTHDESLINYATRVIRIDSGRVISDEKIA